MITCVFMCNVWIGSNVGLNGYDGDGDITKPVNLKAFQEYVIAQTGGRGVHFVMGDGVSIT